MQWCARADVALVARADCVFTSIGHGGSIGTMGMDRSYKSGIFFFWGGEVKSAQVLVVQACLTLCDPMDCSLPGSSSPWNSPGKNTGVGCHSLLQAIFLTKGLNSGLLHCRKILYHLSHQGWGRGWLACY